MKRSLLVYILFLIVTHSFSQSKWSIVSGKIKSPWADSVNPSNVLPDYPRPQMQRSAWVNLNGVVISFKLEVIPFL